VLGAADVSTAVLQNSVTGLGSLSAEPSSHPFLAFSKWWLQSWLCEVSTTANKLSTQVCSNLEYTYFLCALCYSAHHTVYDVRSLHNQIYRFKSNWST